MEASVAQTDRIWAGLVIDDSGRASDERDLREILGTDAALIVIRGTEAMIDSIRRIVQARCSCILARMNPGDVDSRAPLLNVASALSSLRRIVVLHDAESRLAPSVLQRGVLMLRDCAEVREALTLLIARESAANATHTFGAGKPAHARPLRSRAGGRVKALPRSTASESEGVCPPGDDPECRSRSMST